MFFLCDLILHFHLFSPSHFFFEVGLFCLAFLMFQFLASPSPRMECVEHVEHMEQQRAYPTKEWKFKHPANKCAIFAQKDSVPCSADVLASSCCHRSTLTWPPLEGALSFGERFPHCHKLSFL